MENLLIEPWVDAIENETDEFYVPEYIVNMAWSVLESYPLKVSSMVCITTKSDKGGAIWKIETDQGPKSLKLLHRRPLRSLFSLGAQEYLVEVQKARVPALVKTKDGVNFVEAGGKLWFVADWIEELTPASKDLEGAKQLCYALGEFHRLTKGYKPPRQAELASRLLKWPKTYEKMLTKMDWFRNIANAYSEMPASQIILDTVDHFEQQALTSLERLQNSHYKDLVKLGNEYWGLVHQDYGWSNGQSGPGGMWIIDLDGVAYDLPIRDLSKLITGTMSDLLTWDVEFVRGMIEAYHEANPISLELYEILMIDLSLPIDYYKNVKEMVYEPELFLNEQTEAMVQRIVETDQSKWPVLDEIANDWKDKDGAESLLPYIAQHVSELSNQVESSELSIFTEGSWVVPSRSFNLDEANEETLFIQDEDNKKEKDKKKDKKKKDKDKEKEKDKDKKKQDKKKDKQKDLEKEEKKRLKKEEKKRLKKEEKKAKKKNKDGDK